MTMHLQVPLKNLKFGHEAPVHPSNARVTGRMDGIATLAANIHSRGQIEDLIVFDDGVPDIYFVSDGNRSLAALRMIHGNTSSELIDCKVRPAEQAFEDSLAVAVLGHKLHPVDEYEGFARLRDQMGKTEEEIALQYGLTEKQVEQVLALGHLAPLIRDAWRNKQIKADVAKAFTLAPDHKTQVNIFEKLSKQQQENERRLGDLDDDDVKDALKITDSEDGALVEFVGIDAYVAAGGKVTRDLFGTDHKISDAKLAKKMASEKLDAECAALVAAGWSFAVNIKTVKNRYDYSTLKVEARPTSEEQKRLEVLESVFRDPDNHNSIYLDDLPQSQQAARIEYHELEKAIELRPYTPALMAKAGCFVELDFRGRLKIEYGKVKPAQKKAAEKEIKTAARAAAKASPSGGGTAAAEPSAPTVISNALRDRLEAALVAGTRDAIGTATEATELLKSPLAQLLGKIVCAQITVNGSMYSMPDAVRTKLAAIREALPASLINNAILKRFDAADYFGNAPKPVLLKAIAEAINPEEARKVAGKKKADLGKFALANLGKSAWVPKEMRTLHYVGPKIGKAAKSAEPAGGVLATAMSDALAKAKKKAASAPPAKKPPAAKAKPVKRAVAKKAAKKASAKKKR
jgi:ParB family transcriptional regulator, chromosome partitioning protein